MEFEHPAGPGEIFDFHAHYDDAAFDADREQLLCELPKLGVGGILNCGVDLASNEACIRLADRHSICFAACGYHPENLPEGPLDLQTLAGQLSKPKVVALGEIGLDYHWEESPSGRQRQKEAFEAQLRLAKELAVPVIIHDRDAHADTLALLKKYRPAGVVHCFSGSAEMANEILELGMLIGVGGVITFQNAKKLVRVVEKLPLERLLLETDAPYLAPAPYRGKRCHSGMIARTAEKIAELKKTDRETIFGASLANGKALFHL